MVDRQWVQEHAFVGVEAVLGPHGGTAAPDARVAAALGATPTLQVGGFPVLSPSFGCSQGRDGVAAHLRRWRDAVRVVRLERQFAVVDGFAASCHYDVGLEFPAGAACDLEMVALVELDRDGRLRDLELYFDTATFLKASRAEGGRFRDVRGATSHPVPDPGSPVLAGPAQARVYDTFLRLGDGSATWEEFYALFADDVEVVFKSNTDVVPYAGRYAGKEGLRRWFEDLFSIWSLNAFNYTRWYAEGDCADMAMHELHYYANPDGTRRYLDVYIVQSWRTDADGRIARFTSYNDSAWLDETWHASPAYREHYGHPAPDPASRTAPDGPAGRALATAGPA